MNGGAMDGAVDRRRFLCAAGAAGISVLAQPRAARALLSRTSRLGPPIRGQVMSRGTPGFLSAARVFNERFDGVLPSLIARPLDAGDVQTAVRWAAANGVSLRARSGGHSYAGYSTIADGMVVDLRNLNTVTVDRRSATATIGAGAQLIDVYTALAAHQATLPAGSCPSVGIGGHVLGGGMGLAARYLGLAADNLLSARVVTADGRLRTASSSSEPDLYWALRGGGGGNFGVAADLTFRIHAVPRTVAAFFISWPWSHAVDALEAWQAWAPHAPAPITSLFHLEGGAGTATARLVGQYFGPASDLPRLLFPLTRVSHATVSARDYGYLQLQRLWAGCANTPLAACHTTGTRSGGALPRADFRAKSRYVTTPLPRAALTTLVDAAGARARSGGSGQILFDAYGGAINRIAPEATAFVHRQSLYCVQCIDYPGSGAWLDSTAARLASVTPAAAYVNYIDPDLGDWRTAYYGSNYNRLVSVQREYDPSHVFDFPQAVGH